MAAPSVPTVVVDTTVHFSACRSDGSTSPNKETIHRAAHGHYSMAVSPLLIAEVYKKLRQLGFEELPVKSYCAQLLKLGVICADVAPEGTVSCRDPNDVYVLMLAVVSKSTWLVSSDKDLLDDDCVCPGVERLPPVPFLKKLRGLRGESASAFVTHGAVFLKQTHGDQGTKLASLVRK
ncbi:putative toxin-antitoxin system toxin component, PIN family [Sorangium cellulosum]|uniref:putative toxin-antitoxin system toxin component, PIN family n=1 Tax=Sorangium cellulosum TaxID=56 RepID=UPI0009D6F8AE